MPTFLLSLSQLSQTCHVFLKTIVRIQVFLHELRAIYSFKHVNMILNIKGKKTIIWISLIIFFNSKVLSISQSLSTLFTVHHTSKHISFDNCKYTKRQCLKCIPLQNWKLKTIIFYTFFFKQQKVLSVSFMLIMGPNMWLCKSTRIEADVNCSTTCKENIRMNQSNQETSINNSITNTGTLRSHSTNLTVLWAWVLTGK